MSAAVANEPAPLAGGLAPLLDAGDVARIFGLKRETILGWAQDGRLPKPIRVSRRSPRWTRDVIVAHIEALAAGAAR
jgi:predicted DNA-binding transcriptional regulator AlpA